MYLFGLLSPCEEGQQRESRLEYAGQSVSAVHHSAEVPSVRHALLQRRQINLRRVAEDDHPHRHLEPVKVHGHRTQTPARPPRRLTETVADHDEGDEELSQRAEEAETRHRPQVTDQHAGHQDQKGDDGAGGRAHGQEEEAVTHQVASDDQVKDAGHGELHHLGGVHQLPPDAGADVSAAGFGDVLVRVPDADRAAALVLFVQTGHQNLARITADESGRYQRDQTHVTALMQGEGKTQHEQTLTKHTEKNKHQ